MHTVNAGERGGLVVELRTPKREVGGLIPTTGVLCPLNKDTFTPRKVQIIPWKRWLRPDMTEQELSHDSIARLNCALPITKTISVIR